MGTLARNFLNCSEGKTGKRFATGHQASPRQSANHNPGLLSTRIGSLSRSYTSHPCLAPRRPFPPHIPPPLTPARGSPAESPSSQFFAVGVSQPRQASSAQEHGPPHSRRSEYGEPRGSISASDFAFPRADQRARLTPPPWWEDYLTEQSCGSRPQALSKRKSCRYPAPARCGCRCCYWLRCCWSSSAKFTRGCSQAAPRTPSWRMSNGHPRLW